MKLLSILLLSFSISYAQTGEICDENGNLIIGLANQLAVPNCLTPDNVESAVRNNDQSKICGTCKDQFQRNLNRSISPVDEKTKKAQFIDLALKEYKKVITENLVEVLKLRTLRPTGSKFEKSSASCKMNSIDQLTRDCDPSIKQMIKESGIFSNMNKEISNELARLISSDSSFSPSPTLLTRPQAPLCYIAEKDILLISSRAAEEALSPALMDALATFDVSEVAELSHLAFDENLSEIYEGNFDDLISALRSHPLLSKYTRSPKELVDFIKSVPSPRTVDSLRKTIYSKDAGNEFDEKLARSCEKSLQVLTQSLCSPDLENGKFNLDSFSNHQKLYQKPVPINVADLATNDDLLKSNEELLRLCDVSPERNKLSLLKTTISLGEDLRPSYKDLAFDLFKSQKFNVEMGNLNRQICESANNKCEDATFECLLIKKYNDLKNSGSEESKLALSSNTEVNNLLRSMLGDTRNIEPKTKEILIAQGIIPRDDGTIVAQPDIPERRAEYYAQENSSQNNGPLRTNVAQTTPNQSNRTAVTRTPASTNDNYTNVGNSESLSSNQSNFADFSDILDDSSQDLKRMQDEIRRRLLDLPSADQRDPDKVRSVVRQSSRKLGRSLSPQELNSVTNRIINNDSPAEASGFDSSRAQVSNEAAVSGTETQLEKWKNGQRDAALMGMAGAQQVLSKNGEAPAANASASKELTKIALNIPEDPQVKLSDVFYQKLNLNDSETQLLKVLMKNKNNFLLQVNSLNFRIVFNQENSFNVLLENGSAEDAERIRPQLEMFLKRLRK